MRKNANLWLKSLLTLFLCFNTVILYNNLDLDDYSFSPDDLIKNNSNNNINREVIESDILDSLEGYQTITLQGTLEDQGRTQGLLLKDSIHSNVKNYWSRIQNAGYSREEIMEIVNKREKAAQLENPEDLAEIKAMAEAADIPYEDLLAFNLYTEIDYEDEDRDHCTAWIAHGTATKNGHTLFHKNRDDDRATQVVTNVAASGGSNGYRAIVSSGSTGVSMGINDQGLALGNTYCDTSDLNYLSSKGSLTAQREILEQCDNVDEVFAYLDDVFSGSGLNQGSNLFVVNDTTAAIIEHTGYRRCTKEQALTVNDVAYRSNYYIFLESRDSGTLEDTRMTRYEDSRDFLEQRKGTLTALDFNELSRYHRMIDEEIPSEHNGKDGSISNYHTLCGGTFEIDDDYPSELSVMWTALGTPCTAMYAPIHIGATTVSATYTGSGAWDLAELILDSQDLKEFPFGSLVPYYLNLEAEMMDEELAIRTAAKNYFDSSNPSQGKLLLTNFDGNKSNYVYDQMSFINNKKIWQDSFLYKNAIQSSSNVNWSNTEGEFKLKEIINPIRKIKYDFNGVAPSTLNFNAYMDDIETYPYLSVQSNRNSHTEASTANYQSIWASDNNRWQTTDPGSSDESFIWIEMKINENPSEIEEIQFTFEGYSAETSDGLQAEFFMYLLRDGKNWWDDSSWYRLGSRLEILSGTDKVMTRSLTSDFDDFISPTGSLIWMVGTPFGHSDEIFCDYVKIDVIKKPTGLRTYETSGNLQSIQIDYGSSSWDQFIFKANHTVPTGTDITYNIQNSASTNLYWITADEAEQGYVMRGLGTQILRLAAEFSTTNTSRTPILYDWSINWSSNPPPAKVSGVSTTPVGPDKISVNWIANTETDINHYNIYRNDSKIGESLTNEYDDSGLEENTSYTYRISAIDNSEQEGLKSNASTVKTYEKIRYSPKISDISWFPISPFDRESVAVEANVTDSDGISKAILSYYDGLIWSNVSMSYIPSTTMYNGTIPGLHAGLTVFFKIFANDTGGNSSESGIHNYYVKNLGPPSISNISWSPITPFDGQQVIVTANITDPDDIWTAILSYNIGSGWTNHSMPYNDETHLYQGNIPGLAANTLVNFKVYGQDKLWAWNGSQTKSYTILNTGGPSISNVTLSPNPPYDGNQVLITANVSDPSGVVSVKLYSNNGSTEINFTMTYNSVSMLYEGMIPGMSAGISVYYKVYAQDGASAWNASEQDNFNVLNAGGPSISNILWYPNSPFEDEQIEVRAKVVDPSNINSVKLSYNSGSNWINITMSYNSVKQLYEGTIPGFRGGKTVTFKIYAQDGAGAWNVSAENIFNVQNLTDADDDKEKDSEEDITGNNNLVFILLVIAIGAVISIGVIGSIVFIKKQKRNKLVKTLVKDGPHDKSTFDFLPKKKSDNDFDIEFEE